MQPIDTPPKGLEDDIAAVRKAVVMELDEGHDVVVVAHSYGGTPANSALQGLDPRIRKSSGSGSAILAIIFVAAIARPIGSTVLEAFGGDLFEGKESSPPKNAIHDFTRSKDFCDVGPPGPEHYFYNDLSPEQAKKYSSMLQPQSWLAYQQKTTYAAYKDIPTWYVVCSKDQAIPPPVQEVFVKMMEDDGARVKTRTLNSSHSPFLSMPKETARCILEAAEEASAAS